MKKLPQLLAGLDAIIYGHGISFIDSSYAASLKRECVISVLPDNLDFNHMSGINLEELAKRKIPVVAINPEDQTLALSKHIAHLAAKRCYESGVSLFRIANI
ncbi:MAG: hypothetical protein MZV70_76785 [Desulfobacterales bacterium]|nr:hypothetical protein [Desulfobacterales bacterium]